MKSTQLRFRSTFSSVTRRCHAKPCGFTACISSTAVSAGSAGGWRSSAICGPLPAKPSTPCVAEMTTSTRVASRGPSQAVSQASGSPAGPVSGCGQCCSVAPALRAAVRNLSRASANEREKTERSIACIQVGTRAIVLAVRSVRDQGAVGVGMPAMRSCRRKNCRASATSWLSLGWSTVWVATIFGASAGRCFFT